MGNAHKHPDTRPRVEPTTRCPLPALPPNPRFSGLYRARHNDAMTHSDEQFDAYRGAARQ